MDRCALFVDAGYLLADGALAVHGTRHREAVSWDYPGLLQLMTNLSRERTALPLLRCYWYEATVEGRRTPEHDALADIPGLKLRLSRIRPGRREGVDAQVHRDLMTLARNNAICDAVVVSGDEDLAQVVCDAQDLGIRVTVINIAAEGSWAVSRSLRQECDDLVELGAPHLRPYVSLVTGISEASNGHHQPIGNGQATHSLPAAQPSLPPAPSSTGSHAAGPSSAAQPRSGPDSPSYGGPNTPSSAGSGTSSYGGSGSASYGGSGAGSSDGSGSNVPSYGGSGANTPSSAPSYGGSGANTPSSAPSYGGSGANSASPGGNVSSYGGSHANGQVSGGSGANGQLPGGSDADGPMRGQPSTPPALPPYSGYQGEQQQPQTNAPSSAPVTGPVQAQSPSTGQFSSPSSAGSYQQSNSAAYQPSQPGPYTGPQPAPVVPPSAATAGATTLADAVKAAHREGHDFGESVARDAPALWLEAVLARKPRMPSDLEARLLQGSSLPIDFLLHDEVRHALRRGFWDALERARN
ncbi:NYN domain-containing protein [Nonomuraea terrae]|uniref:NYN domain-containing protein n=1 Tax=Nonomuraea terrae TaxID=2530383 RepID=A0A4R4Z556_9ACTN|nr:NYN domain-containing protein [Nonomuraea terrae]TDD52600.1 NYN domain-containing protein [Nonomuraea terrae]